VDRRSDGVGQGRRANINIYVGVQFSHPYFFYGDQDNARNAARGIRIKRRRGINPPSPLGKLLYDDT
jgi:hypothetical protein